MQPNQQENQVKASEYNEVKEILKSAQKDRKKHAWTMRQKGKTFAEIGHALGITRQGAAQLVSSYEKARRKK